MAARLNPGHDQKTRAKIQTSQLVNRLQGFALLTPEDENQASKTMTRDQIAAAKILLGKTLPDLTAAAISGDGDNPLKVITTIELVAPGYDDGDESTA